MATSSLLGRTAEIALLERAWEAARAGTPQLALVWGRRRVGKTFLLSHFVKGKRAVFSGATQQAESIELARLLDATRRDLGDSEGDLSGGTFSSWEAALRFLAALAGDEPLIVVLDEVPYLSRSTPGFASIVQVVWDHLRRGTKLLLILTGSAVGMIEKTIGPGGPLRGRPTLQMRLDPFDAVEARAFLRRLREHEYFEAYSACGGYPLHLRAWDESQDTASNLRRLAGEPGGLLLEDAASILREELPETGGYPRILAAIGRGRTRASDIATDADQRIEAPLEVLVRAGFVRKSIPIGAPRRARPLYEIDDVYLAYWFGVLYSDLPQIEAAQGRAVLQRRLPQWRRHLAWVFEEAARAHAARLVARGDLPEDMVVGRWWASSGEPCEVDVLGMQGSRTRLLGEVKWRDRPLGLRDVEELMLKRDRVPDPADEPIYALWGRAGVDRAVTRAGILGYRLEHVLKR